jgi:hypothetical protein
VVEFNNQAQSQRDYLPSLIQYSVALVLSALMSLFKVLL